MKNATLFVLFLSGIAIVSPDCSGKPMDLVFLLDSSTSVGQTNFVDMIDFMKFLLSAVDIENGTVRVGVVTYSTRAHIQIQMSTSIKDRRGLFEAIDRIPYTYGSTNTYGALNTARTQMFIPESGDRFDVNNICVLMTEGVSNINASRVLPEAQLMRDMGIEIYAIGIGILDTREIDAIASQPLDKHTFNVADFSQLSGIRSEIIKLICS